MKLKKEKFGLTDMRVSKLCLSTSNFARHVSQEDSFAILDAFRAAGGNFFQTSGMCPGVNLGDGFLGLPETILGRWLKLRNVERASVTIATRIALSRPVIGGVAIFTDLIRSCAQDSVRRMDSGHLDLLVLEWTDGIVPVPETIAAIEAVIDSGDVRSVAPADFPVNRVSECLASARRGPKTIGGLQVDYSLANRLGFEAGVEKLSASRRLGVVARSPLAGGHLAATSSNDGAGALRPRGERDRRAAVAAEGIRPLLSAVARDLGASAAQVALSWVMAHPHVSSTLVSVTSVDQLRELLGAARLEFTPDAAERLGRPRPRRVPPLNLYQSATS